MARIFAKATVGGTLPDNDKSYLASVVAQRSGLPQPEAEKRVTEAFAEANRAVKEAADKARRAALLTGFVTAASLVVSLAPPGGQLSVVDTTATTRFRPGSWLLLNAG